jgi:hypothetical protein
VSRVKRVSSLACVSFVFLFIFVSFVWLPVWFACSCVHCLCGVVCARVRVVWCANAWQPEAELEADWSGREVGARGSIGRKEGSSAPRDMGREVEPVIKRLLDAAVRVVEAREAQANEASYLDTEAVGPGQRRLFACAKILAAVTAAPALVSLDVQPAPAPSADVPSQVRAAPSKMDQFRARKGMLAADGAAGRAAKVEWVGGDQGREEPADSAAASAVATAPSAVDASLVERIRVNDGQAEGLLRSALDMLDDQGVPTHGVTPVLANRGSVMRECSSVEECASAGLVHIRETTMCSLQTSTPASQWCRSRRWQPLSWPRRRGARAAPAARGCPPPWLTRRPSCSLQHYRSGSPLSGALALVAKVCCSSAMMGKGPGSPYSNI